MTQSTPEEALFALEFLARHQADLAAGRQLGLADYQALYPGREALVAEEWRRLTGDVADRPPQRIAHYLVERELGSGGQGRVYLARDERLGRQVALKVLHVHGPMAQPYLARFRREAEIAARLDHPGICTVFDTGQCDGLTYIAMRYVAGVSLAERLRQLRADPDAHLGSTEALFGVVRMIERAARAVHAAHQAGILHRDLKPGNIMVGEADVPVILDFGLARDDRDGDSAALTRTGELFGTPLYMAPEQLRGDASLDRRADVYALGATLYEALTLHRPYEGATRESLFSQLLDSEPVSVKKLNRTLPRDLCVVVETAMARERDRRYRTAEDFAEDLRRVGEYRPIEASPTSRAVRAWRWCRRNRAVAALSGLLFVALCSGLAASLVLLRSSEEARRQLQDSLTDIQAGRQSRRSRELERLLSNAYQQLYSADPRTAGPSLDAALSIEPGCVEAIAGRAFAVSADPPRALAVVDDALRGSSGANPELRWLRAYYLRAAGRADEAELEERAAGARETAFRLYWLGMRQAKGFMAKLEAPALRAAVALFQRAITRSARPRFQHHHSVLMAAARLRDRELMDAAAADLEFHWPEAPATFDAIAQFYLPVDRPRALAALRWLVEHTRQAAPYCGLAQEALTRGDTAAAMRWYDQGIAAQADFAPIRWLRGMLHRKRGAHQEARRDFLAAILIEPQQDMYFRSLRHLHRERGSWREALEDFESVLVRHPGEAHAIEALREARTELDAARPGGERR